MGNWGGKNEMFAPSSLRRNFPGIGSTLGGAGYGTGGLFGYGSGWSSGSPGYGSGRRDGTGYNAIESFGYGSGRRDGAGNNYLGSFLKGSGRRDGASYGTGGSFGQGSSRVGGSPGHGLDATYGVSDKSAVESRFPFLSLIDSGRRDGAGYGTSGSFGHGSGRVGGSPGHGLDATYDVSDKSAVESRFPAFSLLGSGRRDGAGYGTSGSFGHIPGRFGGPFGHGLDATYGVGDDSTLESLLKGSGRRDGAGYGIGGSFGYGSGGWVGRFIWIRFRCIVLIILDRSRVSKQSFFHLLFFGLSSI